MSIPEEIETFIEEPEDFVEAEVGIMPLLDNGESGVAAQQGVNPSYTPEIPEI